LVTTILIVFITMFFFALFVTELVVFLYGKNKISGTPDLIVVLGCGNKTEKPLLNDRLEQTIRAHKQNSAIPILLTGDEKNKLEISSMSAYLKSKIPDSQIITDPDSLNTWHSFLYLKKNFSSKKILVVTNEFHQRRSLFFAKLLNLSAMTSGNDLNFSYSCYFFVRERIARLLIYKHIIMNRE
jgi:SanA protein